MIKKTYILVAGGMRAGKDTFASFLTDKWPTKFVKISLADELKERELKLRQVYFEFFCSQLGALGKEIFSIHYESIMAAKNGVALQQLGTEWGRSFDDFAWVKALVARADNYSQPYIVVPDCRFENEFYSQVLLPGIRVIIYADNATILKRLKECGDTRVPWKHSSEGLAAKFYREIEQTERPGEYNSLRTNQIFNTSYQDGLNLDLYRQAVESWAEALLGESHEY